MSNTSRNDVKQIAEKIENLAKDLQRTLTVGGDFLAQANELVRNNMTLVFTAGEVYALEQIGANKTVNATVVSRATTNASRHNVRDPRTGKFAKRV